MRLMRRGVNTRSPRPRKDKAKEGTSFAQKGGKPDKSKSKTGDQDFTCYVCGSKDHKKPACTWADKIPRKDWWVQTKQIPAMVSRAFNQSESVDI